MMLPMSETNWMDPAPCDPTLLTMAFTAASEEASDSGAPGSSEASLEKAMEAIAEVVGGMQLAAPYVVRVWALGALLADGDLGDYTRNANQESVEVSEAVFEIAAVARCRGGQFDRGEFTRLLRERAARPPAAV